MVTLAQTHVDGASNSMGMKPGHGLRGANEFPAFNENVRIAPVYDAIYHWYSLFSLVGVLYTPWFIL